VDFTSPFVVSAFPVRGPSLENQATMQPLVTSSSQDRLSAHAPPWTYTKDPKDNAMFEEDEKRSIGYENIWDKCGV
jgi:hypothetical protein